MRGFGTMPRHSGHDAGERLDHVGYQAASLEAEQAFAAGYEQVARSGRTGPGFDATTYGVQENLRGAAAELEQAGPPEDGLDEAHANLAAGLHAFADGSRRSRSSRPAPIPEPCFRPWTAWSRSAPRSSSRVAPATASTRAPGSLRYSGV